TEPAPKSTKFVRAIFDATALPSSQRSEMLAKRPPNCLAVAVAINEGPLLRLARASQASPFKRAVELLHQGQVGVSSNRDASAPTIIDVGAYDPIEDQIVAKILALPLLADLVNKLDCTCEDPMICPRKVAWKQLSSEKIRERVNDVLRVANLEGQPVLFRDLWDFVADLALGGSCDEEPPTSPWFWRVFRGSSALSSRLNESVDPS